MLGAITIGRWRRRCEHGLAVQLCELRDAGTRRIIRCGRSGRLLKVLSPAFAALYAKTGRSIPPEKLLRALLLQAFYSVRSERQLMEQLDYNLLFRWFVGLAMDPSVLGRDDPPQGQLAPAATPPLRESTYT
jgi:Transposase domain (DUF772)